MFWGRMGVELKERDREISEKVLKMTSLGEANQQLKENLALEIGRTQNFESNQGSWYTSRQGLQKTIQNLQEETNQVKMELTKCQRRALESEQNTHFANERLKGAEKLA